MSRFFHISIQAVRMLLVGAAAGALSLPQVDQNLTSIPSLPVNFNTEEPRVIGGVPASPKEFPHQVHLFSRSGTSVGSCGGSIIGSKWILTAAHCVLFLTNSPVNFKLPADNFHVRFGSVSSFGERIETVEKVIVHPMFDQEAFLSYDFALLKIQGKFKFDDHAQPIALAPRDYEPKGDATISGWGDTKGGNMSIFPSVLQKATLPLNKDSECLKALESLSSFLPESMICAGGGPKSESGGCHGDSGGPLIQKRGKKKILVGIVSWGHSECMLGVPTVFARVSAARKWIKKQTGI